MENAEMKKCPYCAEMIKFEAVKCRYCCSNLSAKDSYKNAAVWQRVNKGKRIAGICTGIAQKFNVPTLILPLRLFFIVTTVIYGFGLCAYIVLWILMEKPTDVKEPLGGSEYSTQSEDKDEAPETAKTI